VVVKVEVDPKAIRREISASHQVHGFRMRKYDRLYGQLLSKQRQYEAFRHVKRNKGAAGSMSRA